MSISNRNHRHNYAAVRRPFHADDKLKHNTQHYKLRQNNKAIKSTEIITVSRDKSPIRLQKPQLNT